MFSGIAAPEEARPDIDWLWCAEIEKFPSTVLEHRHPHIPNLGNVSAPDFIERASAYGSIDVLVAGSPCQDFSVAGNRAGLDGARGSLALRFIEVIKSLRPTWLVFENVPGILSSASHAAPDPSPPQGSLLEGERRIVEDVYEADEGSDFGYLLSALSECGYPGFAWSCLDAQYFGLAQRRDRLFLIGNIRGWQPAAAVLFDFESLSGNPAPRRQTRKELPEALAVALKAAASDQT